MMGRPANLLKSSSSTFWASAGISTDLTRTASVAAAGGCSWAWDAILFDGNVYCVQGQHELVEMEMYLVHGVGQNADLQEYAPRICSQTVSCQLFAFPRTRNYSHPPQSCCPSMKANIAESDRQEGKDRRRPDWATIRDFESGHTGQCRELPGVRD